MEIEQEIEQLKKEIQTLKQPKPEKFKDLDYFPIMKADKADIAVKIVDTTTDLTGREGQITVVSSTNRLTHFSGGSWQ
jgi:hypothetical protein